MPVVITFNDKDIGYTVDLEIPEGLKDMHEITKFIAMCNLSRSGRRGALRAAKKQYKEFGDVLWDIDMEMDSKVESNNET